VDTVALSNFALGGRLDLLIDRYGRRAVVTPQVLDEVLDGIAAGYRALETIREAVAVGKLGTEESLTESGRGIYLTLIRTLGPGEASGIAYAQWRGGTVVTDDRAARTACEERRVRVTGTIGILKACVQDGSLSPEEADAALQSMIDHGYHSPVRRISDLL
jgi:predicted nucleic acid-binding protein